MQVRLIVPNPPTYDVPHDRVQAYGEAIADIAGGFTAMQGTGGWKDDNGTLIVESVTVFDCTMPDEPSTPYSAETGLPQFRQLAKRIARELNQDCVYLSFDGQVEYVKQ